MSKGTEGHFDTLPIGRLGLIPLNSSAALGKKVDDYLVSWRKGRGNEFAEKYVAAYEGYERDSTLSSLRFRVSVQARQRVSSTNLSAVTISTFCSMSATTA